jgi:hypothetical protein
MLAARGRELEDRSAPYIYNVCDLVLGGNNAVVVGNIYENPELLEQAS